MKYLIKMKWGVFALLISSVSFAQSQGAGNGGGGSAVFYAKMDKLRSHLAYWEQKGELERTFQLKDKGLTGLSLLSALELVWDTPVTFLVKESYGIDSSLPKNFREQLIGEAKSRYVLGGPECQNFKSPSEIICYGPSFEALEKDIQWVVVFHEYLGVAGLENDRKTESRQWSQYPISSGLYWTFVENREPILKEDIIGNGSLDRMPFICNAERQESGNWTNPKASMQFRRSATFVLTASTNDGGYVVPQTVLLQNWNVRGWKADGTPDEICHWAAPECKGHRNRKFLSDTFYQDEISPKEGLFRYGEGLTFLSAEDKGTAKYWMGFDEHSFALTIGDGPNALSSDRQIQFRMTVFPQVQRVRTYTFEHESQDAWEQAMVEYVEIKRRRGETTEIVDRGVLHCSMEPVTPGSDGTIPVWEAFRGFLKIYGKK